MRLFAVVLIGLLAACSDDDGKIDSNTPATAAQIEEGCNATCDLTKKCEPTKYEATCVDECKKDGAQMAKNLRNDIGARWVTCVKAATCGMTKVEDTCLEEATRALIPGFETSAFYTTCKAKMKECQGPDDICSFGVMFIDSVRAKLEACLAGTCAALETCMVAIIGIQDDVKDAGTAQGDGGITADQ